MDLLLIQEPLVRSEPFTGADLYKPAAICSQLIWISMSNIADRKTPIE